MSVGDPSGAGLSSCRWADWHGCYDVQWKSAGLLVDEAFAHPAKFAYGLITRIVAYGLTEGYWRPGDLIGDPFAGVCCGALVACQHGLRWFGVELERRFCDLGKGCDCDGVTKSDYRRWFGRWERADKHWCPGCLAELGKVDESRQASMFSDSAKYVRNSGRIPEVEPHHYVGNLEKARLDGKAVLIQGDSRQFASLVGQCKAVVTSPPWADSRETGLGPGWRNKLTGSNDGDLSKATGRSEGYGHTPGQIGSLKAGELDAVITSPPYADSIQGAHGETETAAETTAKRKTPGGSLGQSQRHGGYGTSEGQIGRDSGETYWQAMAAVFAQCRLALKPGGILVCVVKAYVKGGKIVDLPGDTVKLLESLGFHVFERTRAHLVKVEEHPGLFGDVVTKTTERKSFFKRLAEGKGSPRVDWEEVIWARTEAATSEARGTEEAV
jgi:hypothetical protein